MFGFGGNKNNNEKKEEKKEIKNNNEMKVTDTSNLNKGIENPPDRVIK